MGSIYLHFEKIGAITSFEKMVRELEQLAQRFEESKLNAAAKRLRLLTKILVADGEITESLPEPSDTMMRDQGKLERVYRHPGFTYYPDRRVITINGREVVLTRSETYLMNRFTLTPNIVVDHDQIKMAVWGSEEYSVHAVRTLVSRFRSKLVPDKSQGNFQYLQTMNGMGYRLLEPSKL